MQIHFIYVMRRRLITFAKYQRQLMWPRRPSTFEVLHTTFIIFVNGFCLVVSGFFIGLLWWCSTMSIGWIWIWWLWRWENKFCNLETLCCDFDERIVLFFFFMMVCYIWFWLCIHVCMSCEELGCYGKPIMRSLFWVFKHVLPRVSPPIVLFTRP